MKTKEEVIAVCLERWIKYLQLQDWGVAISIVDKKKMKKTIGLDVRGCVVYELYKHEACIFLLDTVPDTDIESVIVHELLHLCLAPDSRFLDKIIEFVGDDNVKELLTEFYKDGLERLLHQLTSALLKERC